MVGHHHQMATPVQLTRHHAAAFLDPGCSGLVEELRRTWDPLMARQIAAHITLIYPQEITDPAELVAQAVRAVARTAPFTIAVGHPVHDGSPADGVFLQVDDIDGGIRAFRTAAVPPGRAIDFPPHVTVVHPRTSAQGERAWAELAGTRIQLRCTISRVAITAFDGGRWQTLQILALTGRKRTS